MSRQNPHIVDNLFLLIGDNPLPNYVAVELLLHKEQAEHGDRQQTDDPTKYNKGYVVLVHSQGTNKTTKSLKEFLQKKGYTKIKTVEVKEADPITIRSGIYNTIVKNQLIGNMGVNYTGGTKAMAVHAYLEFQRLSQPIQLHEADHQRPVLQSVQYSYLDARTLSMIIEGPGGPLLPDVWKDVSITLPELAELHDLDLFNPRRPMTNTTVWNGVQDALAKIYENEAKVELWTTWLTAVRPILDTSFRPTNPDQQTLKPDQKLSEELPVDICNAFQAEKIDTSITLEAFANVDPFRDGKLLFEWLHGKWFEQYVYRLLQPLEQDQSIHDLVITVNPYIKGSNLDFEIDIAFLRGYQLFAVTCTTARASKPCKQKLIEMVVRAEQLGGREAQIALVSCANAPSNIQNQVSKLFHGRHVRVFGREDLRNGKLGDKLRQWFEDVTR